MSSKGASINESDWQEVCEQSDLVPGAGVAALIGEAQVAIFYLPDEDPAIHIIDNFDPYSDANVLSRGIVGDTDGELVVASPVYKQHFSLTTGRCIEDEKVAVAVWPARLRAGWVLVAPGTLVTDSEPASRPQTAAPEPAGD